MECAGISSGMRSINNHVSTRNSLTQYDREHHIRTKGNLDYDIMLTEQVRYSELIGAYSQIRQDIQLVAKRVYHLERSLGALKEKRSKRRLRLSINNQIQNIESELVSCREDWIDLVGEQEMLAGEISAIGRF